MADQFHCYDGCAKFAWTSGRDEEASESGSESLASSDGEADASPLIAWVHIIRRIRHYFGRGQGHHHLGRAYEACGVRGRPKVGVPGGTRYLVYSSQFLAQSFSHYRPRYMALWEAAQVAQHFGEVGARSSRARQLKKHGKLMRLGHRLSVSQWFPNASPRECIGKYRESAGKALGRHWGALENLAKPLGEVMCKYWETRRALSAGRQ
jgi:hypothetical protein